MFVDEGLVQPSIMKAAKAPVILFVIYMIFMKTKLSTWEGECGWLEGQKNGEIGQPDETVECLLRQLCVTYVLYDPMW
jgi:hypothetical protein